MFKQSLHAAAVGSLVFLAACSSGSDSGNETASSSTMTVSRVEGPLDPVQDQISGSVLAPLTDAVAGTPLEGVLRCTDETVTYNVLDIADTVLAQLQASALSGGGVPLDPNPQALAASLGSLAANLTQLLQALAGQGQGCSGDVIPLSQIDSGANPLAGTPLAPLGDAIGPVLAQIIALLNGNGRVDQDLQLSTVAALITQLNQALQSGLAQIPADAYAAPVVGGALTTLSLALNDTDALLSAVLAYDGVATGARLQTLLDHTLVNLLTEVVPVRLIEQQAGQPGVLSGPIESGVAQLADLLGTTVGTVSTPVLANVLGGALDPVLDPIENQLLPALLGPLGDALAGGTGTGLSTDPLAGTPLAPVLGIVSDVVGSLLGAGGSGSCPFAGLPLLSTLCGR